MAQKKDGHPAASASRGRMARQPLWDPLMRVARLCAPGRLRTCVDMIPYQWPWRQPTRLMVCQRWASEPAMMTDGAAMAAFLTFSEVSLAFRVLQRA